MSDTIQRYSAVISPPAKSLGGYWVTHVDHLAAMAAKDADIEMLRAMYSRAEQEAAGLRADAGRYRWLRDRYVVTLLNGECELRITRGPRASNKAGIDAAIDAARARGGE
jgi:hypothetical protein